LHALLRVQCFIIYLIKVSPPLEIFVNLFAFSFEWTPGLKIAPESDNCFTSSLPCRPTHRLPKFYLNGNSSQILIQLCNILFGSSRIFTSTPRIDHWYFPLHLVSLELRTHFIENSRKLILYYRLDIYSNPIIDVMPP
jgi:hypothetical protein